jgi:hypothetical protein
MCNLKDDSLKTDILKRIIKNLLTTFSLTILLISCNKTTPAGFWLNFHTDLILNKLNDQGPWGGQREIRWKSKNQLYFSDIELIEFAEKNNWQLLDSITFSKNTFTKSNLSKLKNDDISLDLIKERILPNLKTNDNKIFIFKTKWLAVEPGNTRETFENGFAILNSNKTELTILHFWGE